MRGVHLYIILMFILLTESIYPTGSTDSTFTTGLTGVLILISLISFSIALLVYMIGKLLDNPYIVSYSHTILSEWVLGITVGLAVIILFIASDNIGGTGHGLMDEARRVLDLRYQEIKTMYFALGRAYFTLSKYTGFSYSRVLGLPVINWLYTEFRSGAPGAGLAPLNSQLYSASAKMSQIMLIVMGERILLDYISVVVPMLFLPLGIMFYFLPPTRRVGGSLLALSISTYILFPITILLYDSLSHAIENGTGYNIHSQATNVERVAGQADPGDIPYGPMIANPLLVPLAQLGDLGFAIMTCTPICAALSIVGVPFSACWAACKPIAELVYIVAVPGFQWIAGSALEGHLDVESNVGPLFHMTVDTILPTVGFIWLETIIGFIIVASVVVISTRSISQSIGGFVGLPGLTRLI